MPDEAGASTATDSASTTAQAPATPAGGRDGPASATAETDDRRAAAKLAAAMAEDDDGDDVSGDDLETRLKKAEAKREKAEAGEAKWKEHARLWESRRAPELRELQAAAKELEELKRAQMTEQERIQAERDQFKAEAIEAKSYNWRLMACVNYGLELDDMDDLHGSTEDEINTSAERLARKLNERAAKLAAEQAQAQASGGQQQQPRNGAGFRPVESLRPGALPASDSKPQDPNAWLRAALTKQK